MRTRSISISNDYDDVWMHLKNQPNVSRYVCDLIRRDIKNELNFEDKVRKIVEELIANTSSKNVSAEDLKNLLDF